MAGDSVVLCAGDGVAECFDEGHDAQDSSGWSQSRRTLYHPSPSINPPDLPAFPPETFEFPGSHRPTSDGRAPQLQYNVRGSNCFPDDFDSTLVYSSPFYGAGASPAPRGRGTGSIFFKTKLCSRFGAGTCPYNSSCNFAHGVEELRKPPPGWEEMISVQEAERAARGGSKKQIQVLEEARGAVDCQRFHKMPERCRRFYTKEGCPYGDRCIFVHDDQGSQVRVLRESNAISLEPAMTISGLAAGAGVAMERSSSWRSRICHKWETTGYCPFGQKCHFIHAGNSDRPSSVTDSKHGVNATVLSQAQSQGSRGEQKWKGPMDKITTIYGDWIEEDEWDISMMAG